MTNGLYNFSDHLSGRFTNTGLLRKFTPFINGFRDFANDFFTLR